MQADKPDKPFSFTESIHSIWDKIANWLHEIILGLPNFIMAIVVFVIFFIIAKYVAKIFDRLLNRRRIQHSIKVLIVRGIKLIIIGVGFFIALGLLNLDKVLTSILAGAGVMGLAIGFAVQGTLKNTVSGIILSFIPEMKIHDWIEADNYAGEVLEVNLRNTLIKESDNNHVIIPNSTIVDSPFKNFSATNRSRVMLTCGVGYESDLEKVEKLTTETIKELFEQQNNEAVEFAYQEFGDSSINFVIRFWTDVKKQRDILFAKHKAILAIKKVFDANDINIPFPIRTLDFDKNKFRAEPMEIVSKKNEGEKS